MGTSFVVVDILKDSVGQCRRIDVGGLLEVLIGNLWRQDHGKRNLAEHE